MNNFDRYLSDINPQMLEDLARKRRIKNAIYDVIGGFIWFGLIAYIAYLVLSYGS